MMLYWVLLIGFITETIANRFGIPFLFLDPEYRGQVGIYSFFLMGLSTGSFIMAFNISSFILNSFRFPFLATLSKTFFNYVHNNFIIPTFFVLLYCFQIFSFQYYSQLKTPLEITLDIAAFLIGTMAVVTLTLRYFMVTNKDIKKLFGVQDSDQVQLSPASLINHHKKEKNWRVDTYIQFPLKVKIVRDTRHYQRYMIERVFRQNHVNAAVIEIIVFVIFIVLGFFRDNSYFRIPAGASILLLFTMLLMLSGVFRFWLRAWANTALVLLFFALNFISQFETFNPRNQAYGLDYTSSKTTFSKESLEAQVNDSILNHDIKHTIKILENWKEKQTNANGEKPKMVLINVSGGGLRSCVFTFRVLQVLDSTYSGNLFNHTSFATGSSGGMISLAYYRELFLSKHDSLMQANQNIDNQYLKNTGKDMLNSVALSATVADIFMNMQRFDDGKYCYVKDRAYAWEQQLQDNTGHVLEKRIADYYKPEYEAKIPMLVISPTIINDGRGLFISSQPVSYLIENTQAQTNDFYQVTSGVEFQRFFKDQNAGNLKFASALRMNSAFPYIMPAISLPSEPTIEVMDAGIRDNYGLLNTIQFLYTFKDWIKENTSGVVVLQIRDTYKKPTIEDNSIRTITEKFSAPMKNVSGNFLLMQDYIFDKQLQYAKSWFDAPLDYVLFQMPEMKERITLSWHLTEKEKKIVKGAALNLQNRTSLESLKKIIPPGQVRN
jgi:hypothetical protein